MTFEQSSTFVVSKCVQFSSQVFENVQISKYNAMWDMPLLKGKLISVQTKILFLCAISRYTFLSRINRNLSHPSKINNLIRPTLFSSSSSKFSLIWFDSIGWGLMRKIKAVRRAVIFTRSSCWIMNYTTSAMHCVHRCN